jgi:hypothetical protein
MAAILLAGFGTPVWAETDDISATVEIWYDGEYLDEITVTDPGTYYTVPAPIPGFTYLNPDLAVTARPSVMDASLRAFTEMGINDDNTEVLWDIRDVPDDDTDELQILGGYILSIWDNAYVENEDGTYDTWLYQLEAEDGTVLNTFDPNDPDNRYATNWTLEDGMRIIWNYTMNVEA